ncbi:MAG: methyltransferase domain-containing protein [Pseudomonadota bacterium]
MNRQQVASVYDRLVAFEAPRHGGTYPVHKKLDLPDGKDVYDLVAEGVAVAPGAIILDAGCGTGFGTSRLAQRLRREALGISLSEPEVTQARAGAGTGAVHFAVQSFDEVDVQAYGLIVAVESLKHSANLARSIRHLIEGLQPGASLVVVDDVLTGAPDPERLRRLEAAWALACVYRESDFIDAHPTITCEIEDLTPWTRRVSLPRLWLRRALLAAASAVRPGVRELAPIYAAGFDLDTLYRRGHMRYLMMRWTAPGS